MSRHTLTPRARHRLVLPAPAAAPQQPDAGDVVARGGGGLLPVVACVAMMWMMGGRPDQR